MASAAEIPRLLPHPRETYLRQNEARILETAAGIIATTPQDPQITAALDAIHFCNDLYLIHSTTVPKFEKLAKPELATRHGSLAAKALQLKFRALDQLSHLVL
jgi:hypothetical protein